MTKKYYILTAIAAYLFFLLATIPAKLAMDLVSDNSTVTLQGISGTLWDGKAHRVNINNKVELTNTAWSFKVWKLLLGNLAIDVDAQYLSHNVTSELGRSFLGTYFVSDLIASIPANEVAQLASLPLAQLSGLLTLDIEHAQWKRGELPTASGTIDWKDATVTVADSASLGDVKILLGESEQELLNADIKNQGGEIKVTGIAELMPDKNYAINIKFSPNASASNSIKQSLELFAKKQNNGEYLFTNSGSLSQIGLM